MKIEVQTPKKFSYVFNIRNVFKPEMLDASIENRNENPENRKENTLPRGSREVAGGLTARFFERRANQGSILTTMLLPRWHYGA